MDNILEDLSNYIEKSSDSVVDHLIKLQDLPSSKEKNTIFGKKVEGGTAVNPVMEQLQLSMKETFSSVVNQIGTKKPPPAMPVPPPHISPEGLVVKPLPKRSLQGAQLPLKHRAWVENLVGDLDAVCTNARSTAIEGASKVTEEIVPPRRDSQLIRKAWKFSESSRFTTLVDSSVERFKRRLHSDFAIIVYTPEELQSSLSSHIDSTIDRSLHRVIAAQPYERLKLDGVYRVVKRREASLCKSLDRIFAAFKTRKRSGRYHQVASLRRALRRSAVGAVREICSPGGRRGRIRSLKFVKRKSFPKKFEGMLSEITEYFMETLLREEKRDLHDEILHVAWPSRYPPSDFRQYLHSSLTHFYESIPSDSESERPTKVTDDVRAKPLFPVLSTRDFEEQVQGVVETAASTACDLPVFAPTGESTAPVPDREGELVTPPPPPIDDADLQQQRYTPRKEDSNKTEGNERQDEKKDNFVMTTTLTADNQLCTTISGFDDSANRLRDHQVDLDASSMEEEEYGEEENELDFELDDFEVVEEWEKTEGEKEEQDSEFVDLTMEEKDDEAERNIFEALQLTPVTNSETVEEEAKNVNARKRPAETDDVREGEVLKKRMIALSSEESDFYSVVKTKFRELPKGTNEQMDTGKDVSLIKSQKSVEGSKKDEPTTKMESQREKGSAHKRRKLKRDFALNIFGTSSDEKDEKCNSPRDAPLHTPSAPSAVAPATVTESRAEEKDLPMETSEVKLVEMARGKEDVLPVSKTTKSGFIEEKPVTRVPSVDKLDETLSRMIKTAQLSCSVTMGDMLGRFIDFVRTKNSTPTELRKVLDLRVQEWDKPKSRLSKPSSSCTAAIESAKSTFTDHVEAVLSTLLVHFSSPMKVKRITRDLRSSASTVPSTEGVHKKLLAPLSSSTPHVTEPVADTVKQPEEDSKTSEPVFVMKPAPRPVKRDVLSKTSLQSRQAQKPVVTARKSSPSKPGDKRPTSPGTNRLRGMLMSYKRDIEKRGEKEESEARAMTADFILQLARSKLAETTKEEEPTKPPTPTPPVKEQLPVPPPVDEPPPEPPVDEPPPEPPRESGTPGSEIPPSSMSSSSTCSSTDATLCSALKQETDAAKGMKTTISRQFLDSVPLPNIPAPQQSEAAGVLPSEQPVPETIVRASGDSEKPLDVGIPGLGDGVDEGTMTVPQKKAGLYQAPWKPSGPTLDSSSTMKISAAATDIKQSIMTPALKTTPTSTSMQARSPWCRRRVIVLNTDEDPVAREAQGLLETWGSFSFDPHNMSFGGREFYVLVHGLWSPEQGSDQMTSRGIQVNLVHLKNSAGVHILSFDSVTQLTGGPETCQVLFPHGRSCLVPDDRALLAAHPDTVRILLDFMEQEKSSGRVWTLKVLNIVLQKMREYRAQQSGPEAARVDALLEHVTSPHRSSVVELVEPTSMLRWPEGLPSTPAFLDYMLEFQRELQTSYRHFCLFTDAALPDYCLFEYARQGVSVLPLDTFIANKTRRQPPDDWPSKLNLDQPSPFPCHFADSSISWCLDTIVLPSAYFAPLGANQ